MTMLDHVPVLLLGQRSEVLARNRLLNVVLSELPLGSEFVRYLFLDPMARARIVNWSHFASTAVAALRRETGRRPFDARLKALVSELRIANEDVNIWWDDHSVRDYASVHKEIDHPLVGRMTFDIESVSPPRDPDQRLVIYTVEPGSPTAQVLPILASWLPSPTSPYTGS
jgi:hypothetical protein